MFTSCLPSNTLTALEWLITNHKDYINKHQFYLAGGTALTLNIGHRVSYDLDWFTKERFEEEQLNNHFLLFNKDIEIITTKLDEQTVYFELNHAKISFIAYPYDLIDDLTEWQGIKLLGLIDIALMKISTIGSRSAKRDFIDLYYILKSKNITLKELFDKFNIKYPNIDSYHFIKSLTYFEEADKDNYLEMKQEINWNDIKKFFVDEAKMLINI